MGEDLTVQSRNDDRNCEPKLSKNQVTLNNPKNQRNKLISIGNQQYLHKSRAIE